VSFDQKRQQLTLAESLVVETPPVAALAPALLYAEQRAAHGGAEHTPIVVNPPVRVLLELAFAKSRHGAIRKRKTTALCKPALTAGGPGRLAAWRTTDN
jgi:hypothetical protein